MSTKEKKAKSSKADDKRSQKKTEEVTIVVDSSTVDSDVAKVEDTQDDTSKDHEKPNESPSGDAEVAEQKKQEEPVLGLLADVNKLTEILVESYDGTFNRGQYEGQGTCKFYDGNFYEGEFHQGMMHGSGKFTWSHGLTYDGEFYHNSVTGKGKYTWPNGSTYDGDVINGLRHGVGTFVEKEGQLSYTGEWDQGKRHGKGKMTYGELGNSFYDGEWFQNIRHGNGTRQYPSGNVYKGMWFNNVRHGDGTMKWVDTNQMYIGQWEDGIQHGLGQHVWFMRRVPGSQYALRNTYNGEFVKGIRHGYGTFYYANGSKYEGYWYNNMKHGKGRFTFKNGRYYEGLFESDHIKEFPNFEMDGNATPDHGAIRTRTPLPMENMSVHSNMSSNTIGPSFQIDLASLIKTTGLSSDDVNSRQVANVVKRHMSALKKVYDFYSTLGYYDSSDNTFILSHIQLHRMMRDCQLHYKHLNLCTIDRLLEFESGPEQNPHDRILFREFLSHMITISVHLYHKENTSDDGTVNFSGCIQTLISNHILKYGCKVQGHFFYETRRAAHALEYLDDAYQVYKSACIPRKDSSISSLKMREFLLLLRDLKLINADLSARDVVCLLTADNPNATDEQDGYNLELELTFLDFFEILVGCAQHYVTEAVAKDPSSTPHVESLAGGLKSATMIGHNLHPAADQLSLASDPTSGKSAGVGDQEEELDGKSSLAPLSPRSGTPGGVRTAPSQAERIQSSTTAAASASKAKTDGSDSMGGGLKPDSAPGAAASMAAQSMQDGASDMQGLDPDKTMELDKELHDIGEEGEGDDQGNEELDETRKFNFWTHQLFIFFVMKFFPAYHNYTTLKQLIRRKSEDRVSTAEHRINCICRGSSVNKPNTPIADLVEMASLSAQNITAATPIQSIPEQA